ncbi:MAG: hypothetical protein ACLQE9_15985 [Roseiarcus sp.]
MMFLVRSTFWFGIVVSNMPLDRPETPVVADQTQAAAIVSAARAVTAACALEGASCRAALAAMAGAVSSLDRPGDRRGAVSSLDRPGDRRSAPHLAATGGVQRPSADSLEAADLTPPWRGPPAKSGV